jgi:hypothetical protein
MKNKADDVFVRFADLDIPEKLFAADVLCHSFCDLHYISVPNSESKQKRF